MNLSNDNGKEKKLALPDLLKQKKKVFSSPAHLEYVFVFSFRNYGMRDLEEKTGRAGRIGIGVGIGPFAITKLHTLVKAKAPKVVKQTHLSYARKSCLVCKIEPKMREIFF